MMRVAVTIDAEHADHPASPDTPARMLDVLAREGARATIFVQGRNIRNAPDLWYRSPPGVEQGKSPYLRQMEAYGANWTFGVRGTF